MTPWTIAFQGPLIFQARILKRVVIPCPLRRYWLWTKVSNCIWKHNFFFPWLVSLGLPNSQLAPNCTLALSDSGYCWPMAKELIQEFLCTNKIILAQQFDSLHSTEYYGINPVFTIFTSCYSNCSWARLEPGKKQLENWVWILGGKKKATSNVREDIGNSCCV